MQENDIVTLDALASRDFPAPSPNAIRESGVSVTSQTQITGEAFNPEIHETPPRLRKNGKYARKRGNKKGFVVGSRKNGQTAAGLAANEPPPAVQSNEPPPLNIPQGPEEIETGEAHAANARDLQTLSNHHSAVIVCNTFMGVGAQLSGYIASEQERLEYIAALEAWFEEMGGIQIKAWVNVAILTGLYGLNAYRNRKQESAFERFKNWCVLKWVNRKWFRFGNHGKTKVEIDGIGEANAAT